MPAHLRGLGRGGQRGAEIRDLDVGVLRQQDVGRLDVAMDHAVSVRVVERLAALEDDLDDLVDRQQIVDLGVLLERAALDVLHDDVAAFLVGHRVEDGRDVRMRQLAGERSLGQEQLAEALAVLLVAQHLALHHLDRHLAVGERSPSPDTRRWWRPFPSSLTIWYFPIFWIMAAGGMDRDSDGRIHCLFNRPMFAVPEVRRLALRSRAARRRQVSNDTNTDRANSERRRRAGRLRREDRCRP